MPERLSAFRTPEFYALYEDAYQATIGLWPVPYEEARLASRFGTTYVIICGASTFPPVVLLHAGSTSSTMWYPNIAYLSRHFRIYAIDNIGEPGRSVPTCVLQNRMESAEWLVGILNDLQIAQPDVVGAAQGGWDAVNLSLHAPDRVRRVVLLSPASVFRKFHMPRGLSGLVLKVLPTASTSRRIIQSWFAPDPHIDEEFAKQTTIAMTGFVDVERGRLRRPFSEDELAWIQNPTLVLMGEKDRINDKRIVDKAWALMHDIDTEVIPDAGFLLSMDQPDVVNACVLRFLLDSRSPATS